MKIQKQQCKHEYRAFIKDPRDVSTNERLYCIHCLKLVSVLMNNFDNEVINPKGVKCFVCDESFYYCNLGEENEGIYHYKCEHFGH